MALLIKFYNNKGHPIFFSRDFQFLNSGLKFPTPDYIDYYSLLQVGKDATINEIRRNYRQLSAMLHPDKLRDQYSEVHKQLYFDVSEAYKVFSDPDTRYAYEYICSNGIPSDVTGDMNSDLHEWAKAAAKHHENIQEYNLAQDLFVQQVLCSLIVAWFVLPKIKETLMYFTNTIFPSTELSQNIEDSQIHPEVELPTAKTDMPDTQAEFASAPNLELSTYAKLVPTP